MNRSPEIKKWDLLHSNNSSRLVYPSEAVIRFLKVHFPVPEEKSILDLGCGSGRHLIYMVEQGFKVSGIDYSKPSIDFVEKYFVDNSLKGEFFHGSVVCLPFENEKFDGIISYGVLLYLDKAEIENAIEEVYRVLKSGGKAFIVVRSTDDLRYGMGKEIEKNTFIIEDDSTNEKGLTMHFFIAEEIKTFFSKFSEIKLGFMNHAHLTTGKYNSDFLITLIK